MTLIGRLGDYAAHPDPRTAACNRIALLVASNQPSYPLYVWWIVGGEWRVTCWTFLSTPFFCAVPLVARRNTVAGRAMLPLTGIANAMLGMKAFGEASGVALFLIPCALIALLAFRRSEWRTTAALLGAALLALLVQARLGAPIGRFDAAQYARFRRLDATSVTMLCGVVLWSLIRARVPTGRRGDRSPPPSPSPPSPSRDPRR